MSKLTRYAFGLALGLCAIQHAAATTVEYTYSANVSLEIRRNQLASFDQLFFLSFAQVSGSFQYDNTAPPVPTGNGTAYSSIFNMTGSIEGNIFSDPSGGIIVINDGFDLTPNNPDDPLTDLLAIGAEGGPVANLAGFTISNGGSLCLLWST